MIRQRVIYVLLACIAVVAGVRTAEAQGGTEVAEVAMFGNTPSRNMVSDETGVPASFDPRTGANILWTQPVGSQAYGGPVVANGKVYVGTNNEGVRNPAYEGDKGVLMAFDATTGDFVWQMVHDKLSAGRVNDWPLQGICSTAFVQGDRVYYVSNQAHIVCLDANGLANGNDGPFTRRDRHRADRRRHHLVLRHDRRARRLSAQPGHRVAGRSSATCSTR